MSDNPLLDNLLSHLDDDASQFLMEYGKRLNFGPGELVVQEGDPSEQVFIILDGVANIIKDDTHHNANVIASVGKGSIIGEMGVFMDLKRSASIRAKGRLAALQLDNQDFVKALLQYPAWTVRLLRSMSTKLSDANQRLADSLHTQHLFYIGMRIQEEIQEKRHPSATDLIPDPCLDDELNLILSLVPLAEDSGYSRLDLTNALLHLDRIAVIKNLHFKQAGRVEFQCAESGLLAFLHRATGQ